MTALDGYGLPDDWSVNWEIDRNDWGSYRDQMQDTEVLA